MTEAAAACDGGCNEPRAGRVPPHVTEAACNLTNLFLGACRVDEEVGGQRLTAAQPHRAPFDFCDLGAAAAAQRDPPVADERRAADVDVEAAAAPKALAEDTRAVRAYNVPNQSCLSVSDPYPALVH